MIFRGVTFLLFTCFLTYTIAVKSELTRKIEKIFEWNNTDPSPEEIRGAYVAARNREIGRKADESFEEDSTNSSDEEMTGPPNDCVCVDNSLCNDTQIYAKGYGIIDLRGNEGECASYVQTCCKPGNIITNPISKIPKPSGCGGRNSDGVGFRKSQALKGEALFGEFPWTVAVLSVEEVEGESLNEYQCGGSLIHPYVIMTAAHCLANKSKVFKIRAGEWDVQTTKELLPHQDRMVYSIIIHPDYNNETLYNDVALAIADSPFVLDEHISVTCLPYTETFTADGTRCWATGWNKRRFGSVMIHQERMMKIDLPFVNRNDCENKLRLPRLVKNIQLHKSFVCAGGEAEKDTCVNYGGGPLVCPIPGKPGRYQQLGIVFGAMGCGKGVVPDVYANVASFRGWLDEEMHTHGFNTSIYTY